MREPWVTDALVALGGEPTVTEEGDIVYVFSELMASAGEEAPPRTLPAAGGAMVRSGAASASSAAVYDALRWSDQPQAWRPAAGEPVLVSALDIDARRRLGRSYLFSAEARRQSFEDSLVLPRSLVGSSGVVAGETSALLAPPLPRGASSDPGSEPSLGDERDSLPFRVRVDTASGPVEAYFLRSELRPVPAELVGGSVAALVELPQRFSTAPPGQLVAAGALGAANLVAVGYLGLLLRSARASALPAAGALGALYPPLLAYALGFVGVPLVRSAVVRRRNRRTEQRNAARRAWAAALASRPAGALRRKLASAKRLRPRLRRAADAPVEYSSAEGFGEEAEAAQRDGIAADFDARLAAAAEAAPDESPGGP